MTSVAKLLLTIFDPEKRFAKRNAKCAVSQNLPGYSPSAILNFARTLGTKLTETSRTSSSHVSRYCRSLMITFHP